MRGKGRGNGGGQRVRLFFLFYTIQTLVCVLLCFANVTAALDALRFYSISCLLLCFMCCSCCYFGCWCCRFDCCLFCCLQLLRRRVSLSLVDCIPTSNTTPHIWAYCWLAVALNIPFRRLQTAASSVGCGSCCVAAADRSQHFTFQNISLRPSSLSCVIFFCLLSDFSVNLCLEIVFINNNNLCYNFNNS